MSKCSLCLSSDYAERRLCSLCGETLCEECNPPQSDPCVECIWVDGPDSEAARAGCGDGRERLHGRTIDEWHAEVIRLTDAAFEALSAPGWPEWEIALRSGLEDPGDPDHVPAVRRVVAWVTRAGHPILSRGDAYREAAILRIHGHKADGEGGLTSAGRLWRRYHRGEAPDMDRLTARLAAWLRHRDEEAGGA